MSAGTGETGYVDDGGLAPDGEHQRSEATSCGDEDDEMRAVFIIMTILCCGAAVFFLCVWEPALAAVNLLMATNTFNLMANYERVRRLQIEWQSRCGQ